VVPTLKDSTIADGMHWTVFFVRARTDTPGIFFDSLPDSGYSVDNLAPDVPRNLIWNYPVELVWDESEDADFNYFTVYGSDYEQLDDDAVLIGYTTGTSLDLSGEYDSYRYYFVTATDFSGNEGRAATLATPADVDVDEALPRTFVLRPTTPNPFASETILSFDLPVACATEFRVYDVRGRLVRTLVDRALLAGRHQVVWDALSERDERVLPGIYFACLRAGGFTATERLVILR
jgi:hypothetical protein